MTFVRHIFCVCRSRRPFSRTFPRTFSPHSLISGKNTLVGRKYLNTAKVNTLISPLKGRSWRGCIVSKNTRTTTRLLHGLRKIMQYLNLKMLFLNLISVVCVATSLWDQASLNRISTVAKGEKHFSIRSVWSVLHFINLHLIAFKG